MTKKEKKPLNRYLSGAHSSEKLLAKLVFVWLYGTPYSEMPDTLAASLSKVDSRIAQVSRMLGSAHEFRENNKHTLSRQSCHNLVGQVSDQINLATYSDRVHQLELLFAFADKSENRSSRLVAEFVKKTGSDFETEFLAPVRRETITEFMRKWATIVEMISANMIPYEAVRKVSTMKPFDNIQEPIILAKLQERYRQFRGYQERAINNHVAHYFSLRFGLDFMKQLNPNMAEFHYESATGQQRENYWVELVMNATVVVLIMLQSGFGYSHIREQVR